jgi:hypothetical protein
VAMTKDLRPQRREICRHQGSLVGSGERGERREERGERGPKIILLCRVSNDYGVYCPL